MPGTEQAYKDKDKDLYVDTQRLEYLDQLLDSYIAEDHRQFIIVRAHRYGVPIYEYCGGMSTHAYGVHQDTISCVFSITKCITSTLVVKLMEDGLLDIAETVSSYLPCFRDSAHDKTQIWQLMTHTSGISDDEWRDFRESRIREFGLEKPDKNASQEVQDLYARQLNSKLGLEEEADSACANDCLFSQYKPSKAPGEAMMYSNTGFFYLGRLIEKVSGMSLHEYSRKVLFEPLGMIDSYYVLPEDKYDRVAGRSDRCYEHEWINTPQNFTWPGAMGGVKTTVVDLCRFGDMLIAGGSLDGVRILSPVSVREMSRDHNHALSEKNPWDSWGLGFNLRKNKKDDSGSLRSENSLEHGGMCGHKFVADLDYGVSIAVFTGEYTYFDKNVFYPINNVILSSLKEI